MPPRKRRRRGHIEKLPSGSYRAVVFAGTDPLTRRPRYARETVETIDQAEKALTRLQSQVDEDKQPKSNLTVRQAIEQWLDVVVLEDTTRERYDDLIRLYILPTFGTLPAARLDAELLERFYARLHRCRTMCTGRARNGHTCRPLSSSTTRKIHYIIRGALGRAVRWQHLGVNKAAMAVAPSPERTEPDPPSADEAARLLDAAWTDPEWGLLLWLTMLTGPRRGEISALRWRHVDFDRGLLTIHRSNAQPKSGLKEKGTKTGQARKIALDQHTVGLLTTHRDLFESRCAELGCTLSPRRLRLLPRPRRLHAVPAPRDQPALPPARPAPQAPQHPPALATPLLGDRARRGRRRHPDRGRPARARQRRRDDSQGLRRVGQRGRPPCSGHHGHDRPEADPRTGAAARAVRDDRGEPACADPKRCAASWRSATNSGAAGGRKHGRDRYSSPGIKPAEGRGPHRGHTR
jgi:integrase